MEKCDICGDVVEKTRQNLFKEHVCIHCEKRLTIEDYQRTRNIVVKKYSGSQWKEEMHLKIIL